nr:hypothetical protein 25 [bacterium]
MTDTRLPVDEDVHDALQAKIDHRSHKLAEGLSEIAALLLQITRPAGDCDTENHECDTRPHESDDYAVIEGVRYRVTKLVWQGADPVAYLVEQETA